MSEIEIDECRTAFEKWNNTSDSHLAHNRWIAWQACWNLKPSAKAQPGAEVVDDWGDDPDPSYKDIIAANHPTITGDHETYADAMRLVGQRHSKYALVDLVNWLLVRAQRAEQAAMGEGKCTQSLSQSEDRGLAARGAEAFSNEVPASPAMPPADAMIREMESAKIIGWAAYRDIANAGVDKCIEIARKHMVAPAVDLEAGAGAILSEMIAQSKPPSCGFDTKRLAKACAEAWGLSAAPQADDGREG